MIRRFAVLLPLCLLSLPVPAAHDTTNSGESCDASARNTLITCPGEELERQEKTLELAVKLLKRHLVEHYGANRVGDRAPWEVIDAAQQKWREFREDECQWRGFAFGNQEMFSYSRVIDCKIDMTRERIRQMEANGRYGPGWFERFEDIGHLRPCTEETAPFGSCVINLSYGLELLMEFPKRGAHHDATLSWRLFPIESDELSLGRYEPNDWDFVVTDLDFDAAGDLIVPMREARGGRMVLEVLSAPGNALQRVGTLQSATPVILRGHYLNGDDKRVAVLETSGRAANAMGETVEYHLFSGDVLETDVLILRRTAEGFCSETSLSGDRAAGLQRLVQVPAACE